MAQEAPADTAGPSSPPPKLPDGWLPQWEGVQRKWYFVQRATGKSQWEIPTEPVVLTPSTTPTSIGTGPTCPPSRPSTNSPRVPWRETTLGERLEPAMGSARLPSSLDAQPNEQLDHPAYGSPGMSVQYSNQTTQRMPHELTQQFVRDGKKNGPQPYHGYSSGSSTFYPANSQIQSTGGQQYLARDSAPVTWSSNSGALRAHTGGQTYQHPASSQPDLVLRSRSSQSSGDNLDSAMTSSHLPSFAALSPPEPQWHPSQQLFIANASTNLAPASFSPSTSQPLSQPYPTPQTVEASPREIDSRSSESLNPSLSRGDIAFSPETSQSTHDSFLMRYSRDYENILAGPGTSNSRAQSQQVNTLPRQGTYVPLSAAQSHGYQQNVPSPYSQYQSPSMSRTWSSGNHSAGPSASEMRGGAPSYHNDLAQVEMRHHQSSEHINHKQVAHHVPGAGAHLQARTSLGYQNPREDSASITSRSATSDPQFVSGPWASTPPASGVPQPPHYN